MRPVIIGFLLSISFFSCSDHVKTPDVSDIKINLTTSRFEKDLYRLDTNHITEQLDQLIAKYPSFGENFLNTILNIDPHCTPDSTAN